MHQHAELAAAHGYHAVIVPIPAKPAVADHSSSSSSAAPARSADAGTPASALSLLQYAAQLQQQLSAAKIPALLDEGTALNPGAEFHRWERLGVPLRLEVGQSEVTAGAVTMALNPGLVPPLLLAAVDSISDDSSRNSGSSSSSSIGEVVRLLQQYAAGWQAQHEELQRRNAAAVTATSAPATAAGHVNAVQAAGMQPLKLAAVPAEQAAAVCRIFLAAVAAVTVSQHNHSLQQQQLQLQCQRQLLPYGCCTKLHSWPSLPAADRPCPAHLQFLLNIRLPCHCGASRHVSWEELQREIQYQLAAISGEGQVTFTFKGTKCSKHTKSGKGGKATAVTARSKNSTRSVSSPEENSGSSSRGVGIFVSGLPTSHSAAAVRQQLLQRLTGLGVSGVTVPASGQGRRSRGQGCCCQTQQQLLLCWKHSTASW